MERKDTQRGAIAGRQMNLFGPDLLNCGTLRLLFCIEGMKLVASSKFTAQGALVCLVVYDAIEFAPKGGRRRIIDIFIIVSGHGRLSLFYFILCCVYPQVSSPTRPIILIHMYYTNE